MIREIAIYRRTKQLHLSGNQTKTLKLCAVCQIKMSHESMHDIKPTSGTFHLTCHSWELMIIGSNVRIKTQNFDHACRDYFQNQD